MYFRCAKAVRSSCVVSLGPDKTSCSYVWKEASAVVSHIKPGEMWDVQLRHKPALEAEGGLEEKKWPPGFFYRLFVGSKYESLENNR